MISEAKRPQIISLFSSYAQEDEKLLLELEKHLRIWERQGLIEHWNRRKISAGSDLQSSVNELLDASDIILLLLSPDFFASDDCFNVEMVHAMARYDAGKAFVVPILLRPSFWRNLPIDKLQSLPRSEQAGVLAIDLWPSKDEAFVQVMGDLLKVIEGFPAPSSPLPMIFSPHPVDDSSLWHIPYPRPNFAVRVNLLTQIHSFLTTSFITSPPALVLTGPGGLGKTELAIEYAYRYKQDYRAIFWLQADSREILITDFMRLADLLGLPEKHGVQQELVVEAVIRSLAAYEPWLLIFDNVKDMSLLKKFLPSSGNGAILLLCRELPTEITMVTIPLGMLEPDEGALFLLRSSQLIAENASLRDVSNVTLNRARRVSELVAGHPLALKLAAAYLKSTKTSLSQYLRLYQEYHDHSLSQSPKSVGIPFLLSLQQLKQEQPAAVELLYFCAFLYADAIPNALFVAETSTPGPTIAAFASQSSQLPMLIEYLLEFSLLEQNAETHTFSIHRQFQGPLKDELTEAEQRQWAERAVRALNYVFPEVHPEVWKKCQLYLPHALVCADLIKQWNLAFPAAARLLNNTGRYLYERAQYPAAQALYQQALDISERTQGVEHLETAAILQNLGELARKLNDYPEAKAHLTQALAIREHLLAPEHAAIAQTLNSLGVLSQTQGDLKSAERLYERALNIRERIGPAYPDTIESLGDVAGIYDEQGKYAEAESYYERARKLCEGTLMPEHPLSILTLGKVARFYRLQGKYAQSEELFERVLSIAKHSLGPVHPELATQLNNCGVLYRQMQKYADSVRVLNQAIDIWSQLFGKDDERTANSRYNLGKTFYEQGDLRQAESLYARVLSLYQQTFGLDDSRTREVQERYRALLKKLGKDEIP